MRNNIALQPLKASLLYNFDLPEKYNEWVYFFQFCFYKILEKCKAQYLLKKRQKGLVLGHLTFFIAYLTIL